MIEAVDKIYNLTTVYIKSEIDSKQQTRELSQIMFVFRGG